MACPVDYSGNNSVLGPHFIKITVILLRCAAFLSIVECRVGGNIVLHLDVVFHRKEGATNSKS